MMYSVLSTITRATSLSAVTMMRSLSFLRFSSLYVLVLLVKVLKTIDTMVQATAVNTIEFICLQSCQSSSGDVFFDGDGCWCN